jgi:hypothetical protein
MNRKIQEPLTLPKHPQLLEELNNMSIAIKLHHIDCAEKHEKAEAWAKAAATKPVPTWEEVQELLIRAYHAINEQRYDPRKY